MPRKRMLLMDRIARSDATFVYADGRWSGACLICGGKLSFGLRDGEGANVEHIVARTAGGSDDLANLALTHPACNGEKGRNWDTKRARRARPDAYAALIVRLQAERLRRWRCPNAGPDSPWRHGGP